MMRYLRMSPSPKKLGLFLSLFLVFPLACVEVPTPQSQIIPKPLPGYCNAQKWCWEHPTPHGNTLFDVFGTSDTNVWAVGAGGTLLHYDGNSWSPAPQSGLLPGLRGVYGFRADDLWAVGEQGTLLHFDGITWKEDPSFKMLITQHTSLKRMPRLYSLWGANATDLWIGGEYSILAHYDGTKWTLVGDLVNIGDPPYHIRKIWGHRADNLWAVTVTPEIGDFPNSQIFHYDGTQWTRSATSDWPINSIFGLSEDDIWAFGYKDALHYDGKVWRSARNLHPSPFPNLSEHDFWSLGGTNETNLWVSGSNSINSEDSESWYWHLNGGTWNKVPYPVLIRDFTREAQSIWGQGSSLWSVGSTGTLMHCQQGLWKLDPESGRGVLWFENSGVGRKFIRHLVDDVHFKSLWIGGPTNIWVGGASEGVLHYNGISWKQMYLTYLTYRFSTITGIWGFGENDVWLISKDYGEIFHYDGKEMTKAYQASVQGNPVELFDIWGASPTDIWVAASNGKLLHYDGMHWKILEIPTNPDPNSNIVSIWGTDRASIWTINQEGTLFRYDGNHWNFVAEDPGKWKGPSWYHDLYGTGPNDLWAVGSKRWLLFNPSENFAGFLHYDGRTWSEVPRDFNVDLTSVWGRSPQDLWVSTIEGETYHFDGKSWHLVQTGISKMNELEVVLSKIRGLPDGQIWAVGAHGAILHYKP